MVAREVRDSDSSDTTETPDFGGGEEPVAPGPIVGADGPAEPEAPEGGAEAAEAAEPEEAGDGRGESEGAPEGGASRPERVYELGIVPRRGPFPKATTASGLVYTYSRVAWIDKAEEEERERIYRERAEERAKGKGAKGDKGAEAKGQAEEWLAENPNRRWRSAEALQRKKNKRAKGKGTGKKGEGKPLIEYGEPEHLQHIVRPERFIFLLQGLLPCLE